MKTFYKFNALTLLTVAFLFLGVGCRPAPSSPAATVRSQRNLEAWQLFEAAEKKHLSAAALSGTNQTAQLNLAAEEYESVLSTYPEQNNWCAQSLRSLGNIRATEGRLAEAVECYQAVVARYPSQDWELLQALKSAGDLLWDAGRRAEASDFYRQISSRFDNTNATAIMRTVVRGAKARLQEQENH